MMKLDEVQLDDKRQFINDFIGASTAADGSKVDANANVTVKDIAVLESELWKDCTIQVNRAMVEERMGQMYGSWLVKSCKRD